MNNPLISIIVPVYNVEKYLEKCINSILQQDYSNLEIILVDDGSTDNSGNICDFFQGKDKRIRTIHKANGGLSSARNAGINVASGEYITFIDSDDYVRNDFVSILINRLQENNADIAVCRFRKVDENGIFLEIAEDYKDYPNGIVTYDNLEAMELLARDDVITSHCCNKLFRMALFHGVRFPEGRIYEDIAIMHFVFAKVNKVVLSPEELYYYLIHSTSTSYRTDVARDFGLFIAFLDRYKYILHNESYNTLSDICLAKVVSEGIGAVYRMNIMKKEGFSEAICKIRFVFKENISLIIKNSLLSIKAKCKVVLIVYMPMGFNLVNKIVHGR